MNLGAPTPRRVRRAVAAATLSNVVAVLPVFMLGALSVPMRREFGYGEVGLGLAVSLFFGVSALTSVGGGWYAQRFGARTAIVFGAGGSALCLLGMGLLASSYEEMLLLLALGGFANAVSQPGANLVLALVVPGRRQGVSFGLKQASVPIATLLAGLAVPLVALHGGWRLAFVLPAGLVMVLAAIWPRGMVPSGDGLSLRGGGSPGLRYGSLAVLAAAAAFGSAAANAMGAFFVESAVATGVGQGAAGLWLGAGSLCGAAGRVLWGWVADRRGGDVLRFVAFLMGGGSAAVFLLGQASHPVWLGLATAVAFGAGWGWTGLFNYAVVRRHDEAPAVAIGVVTTGVFLGGATGPLVFGIVVRHAGYEWAWTVAAIGLVVAAALVVAGRTPHDARDSKTTSLRGKEAQT